MTGDGLKIRRIAATRWQAYRQLRLCALRESPEAFGSTYADALNSQDHDWQARLENASPESDQPMFAVMDDEPVGLGWVMIAPSEPHVAHLYQMWVAPDYRGVGAGRRLVQHAVDWARGKGVRAVALEVTCGDRPARRLYESFGFVPVGNPVPMRDGSTELEQSMLLTLGDVKKGT